MGLEECGMICLFKRMYKSASKLQQYVVLNMLRPNAKRLGFDQKVIQDIEKNKEVIYEPVSPTALFSTELANVTAPVIVATPVTSGAGIKVMTSLKGYGQGVYKQQLDYTLTMPNFLPATSVITATDSTSEFLSGNRDGSAKIGLFCWDLFINDF